MAATKGFVVKNFLWILTGCFLFLGTIAIGIAWACDAESCSTGCCGDTCMTDGQACCNGKVYDPNTSGCCSGSKSKGSVYELASQCCHADGTVSTEKCGPNCYDPATQGCCDGKVFTISTHDCCNSKVIFDIKTSACCCGKEVYNLDTQYCNSCCQTITKAK